MDLDFNSLIQKSIERTFNESKTAPKTSKVLNKTLSFKPVKVISEALNILPKGFLLKTERLSAKTKQIHEIIYKGHVDSFNKSSSQLDASSREEASSNYSAYRSVSRDTIANLNSVKLHEMYFGNISDLASEISMDSIPFIKLARNFGTFEAWQYDFIAACMSSKNGWALCVYDTYKNVYMNVIVDDDTNGIPLGSIPIIVLDMFEHAYFKDYGNDKKSYIVAMMRELNWNVIEARMTVAERSQLGDIWKIMPLVNSQPEVMLTAAAGEASPVPVEPVPASAAQNPQPNMSANPPKLF
jgi:superoxide dismutase, Fe-Mn family